MLVSSGIFALAGLLYCVHFYIGHPDRYAAAKRRHQLTLVEAQILHYESDHGRPPATLQQLAPDYLRADEVQGPSGPIYVFDPIKRTLAEAEGSYIRGIIPYRMKPFGIVIPGTTAPEDTAVAENQATEPEATPKQASPNTIVKTSEPAPSRPVEPEIQVAQAHSPAPAPQPATSDVSEIRSSPAETPVEPQARPRAEPLALRQTALADPPAGAFVFEAENFTETNYGWEAHVDPQSGGGAYLHTKEGVCNGPAQLHYMVGNFYDVHAKTDHTFLRYHFNLSRAGTYYCYARMWTTDTHCSNHLCVDFDNDSRQGSLDNRTPFRWLWTPIDENPNNHDSPHVLAKGDHYINIFIHEDGIRLDQFILSPTRIAEDQPPFKANFIPGHNTLWDKNDGPPAHLSVDLASAVISPDLPLNAKLVVRRLRNSTGTATLKVVLKNAGEKDGDFPVMDTEIDLSKLAELNFFPLSFKSLKLDQLPRREYMLQADLIRDNTSLASFNVVLAKPYAWELFGPGKYMTQDAQGPLDGDNAPKPDDTRKWTQIKDKSYDWFGVLDFGVEYGNNSKHAPQFQTVYARTRVNVPKDGNYLFKVMADDQMVLWVDGEEVFRINDVLPVTRSARSFQHELKAGTHRIRMRINQTEGPWQAYLRIRTEDDATSDIVGLEPEK
jgi:hypothetical protein